MNFLVVDDNPDILHLVSSILKMFGHGADEANDGREAILQFQNNRYDVVITDAEMPNHHHAGKEDGDAAQPYLSCPTVVHRCCYGGLPRLCYGSPDL